jgi:hypothetical protein
MALTRPKRNLFRYAGLTLGPIAWACSTQLGQILPYVDCRSRLPSLAIVTFFLALLSLAGSLLSWRCPTPPAHASPSDRETRDFMQQLSVLAGLLFSFALLLQGTASLVLNGCER